jgi:hypothetical protein
MAAAKKTGRSRKAYKPRVTSGKARGPYNLGTKKARKQWKQTGVYKTPIDAKLAYNLGKIHCTEAEMEVLLGADAITVRNRYQDIIDKGRADGAMSLRRKQINTALAGNPTMLIWCGKQYLGQADKLESMHAHLLVNPDSVRAARERAQLALSQLDKSIVAVQGNGHDTHEALTVSNGNGSARD